MATQTQYYNLDKPSYDEVADIEIINANMDKIDQQMRNNADGVNFAKAISSDAYDNSKLYAVGDYCIYENKLYRCITAIESAEAFTIAKWEQTTVGKEVKQLNSNLDSKLGEVATWCFYNENENQVCEIRFTGQYYACFVLVSARYNTSAYRINVEPSTATAIKIFGDDLDVSDIANKVLKTNPVPYPFNTTYVYIFGISNTDAVEFTQL